MNIRDSALTVFLILNIPGLSYAEDCQMTLSQPIANYNTIHKDTLEMKEQGWYQMPETEVSLNVICPQPQQMAIMVRGSSVQSKDFLFGKNGKILVKIDSMIVDSKSYNVGTTVDELNFTPQKGTTTPLYIQDSEAVIALDNTNVPAGQQMSFKVTLTPKLKESAFASLKDQEILESDLTWSLLTK